MEARRQPPLENRVLYPPRRILTLKVKLWERSEVSLFREVQFVGKTPKLVALPIALTVPVEFVGYLGLAAEPLG